ncbi:hypothetical protein CCH79_00008490, partial [Gambusia affinis]
RVYDITRLAPAAIWEGNDACLEMRDKGPKKNYRSEIREATKKPIATLGELRRPTAQLGESRKLLNGQIYKVPGWKLFWCPIRNHANLSYGGSPAGKSLASAGYKTRARLQDGASHSGSDSSEETHSELPSSASCTLHSVTGTAASSFLYLGLFSSSFHSFIHSFTRGSDLRLLAALMLAAALPLCVPGAPLDGAVTDLPPEESSGEGEEEVQTKPCPTDPFNITETLAQILKVTKGHKEEFKNEFHGNVDYNSLNRTLIPVKFPKSKEARLQQLAQDLTTYSVLLKHVDKEYPGRFTVTELKAALPRLITKVKRTMRNADRVVALTGSQELQLLEEPGSLDSYHRKMMAHSILSSIHDFLVEWKRELTKRQVRRTN